MQKIFRNKMKYLLGVAAVISLIGWSQQARAISLKHSSTVTENVITLGDVFDGLPENADKVLGAAPRPGQEMVLNARTLLRIALALDLPWRPSSNAERVVLKRAATVVDHAAMETALREALTAQGVTGSYKIALPGNMGEMILPEHLPVSVEVRDLKFNAQNKIFEATLVAPSKETPITEMRVTGSIQKLAQIPVLRENMTAGTIIGKNDVEMIEVPERDLNHDMVISSENLIGMTPRRMLMAGTPVRNNELDKPKLVERGESVTMVFSHAGLMLTSTGKALEHGAMGDRIRVVNNTSNKTIEAIVTASEEVTVSDSF